MFSCLLILTHLAWVCTFRSTAHFLKDITAIISNYLYVSLCEYVHILWTAGCRSSEPQKAVNCPGVKPPLQIPNAHFKILVMFYYCNLNSILIKPSSLHTLEQVPCPLHTWVFFSDLFLSYKRLLERGWLAWALMHQLYLLWFMFCLRNFAVFLKVTLTVHLF